MKKGSGDALAQFACSSGYLDDPQAVEIDPVELKLRASRAAFVLRKAVHQMNRN